MNQSSDSVKDSFLFFRVWRRMPLPTTKCKLGGGGATGNATIATKAGGIAEGDEGSGIPKAVICSTSPMEWFFQGLFNVQWLWLL